MNETEKNDLFYVCSLIEYIGRKTNNRRRVIVDFLKMDGIEKQLKDAQVNHCLTFEQVSDELIVQYRIPNGDFDTISSCPYTIPSVTSIGKVYRQLILDCAKPGKEKEELMKVFQSSLSDEISDFWTGVYYENPSYLKCSYEAGYLLV